MLIGIFGLSAFNLFAQTKISGLWEGSITHGGIYANSAYKFQLYLKKEGNIITGKSSIFISEDSIIQMNVRGKIYDDLSVYFEDISFLATPTPDIERPFFRKYQLVFNRSIWEGSLKGYWQQIICSPFEKKRRRGRIFLKKNRVEKA